MPCRNDTPPVDYTGILVELLCEAVRYNIAKGHKMTERLGRWAELHAWVDEARKRSEEADKKLKVAEDAARKNNLRVGSGHPAALAAAKASTALSDATTAEWQYLEELMNKKAKK